MFEALAELALDSLPHHATASCSVFDVHSESSEVRQLVNVLGVGIHRSPDNKTAPLCSGRTARALKISSLILASGSSLTIYKAPSSSFVAMPLLSGETTAGSSPAAQRIVSDHLAQRQGKTAIFGAHFLAVAGARPISAAGRIDLPSGIVKEMFCQVVQRQFDMHARWEHGPKYAHVEPGFEGRHLAEFMERLSG